MNASRERERTISPLERIVGGLRKWPEFLRAAAKDTRRANKAYTLLEPSECDAIAGEIERLKADAARYQYVRNKYWFQSEASHRLRITPRAIEDIDAGIDNAISQSTVRQDQPPNAGYTAPVSHNTADEPGRT